MAPTPTGTIDHSFAEAHVLVTGGAGFLGSWLCERLVRAGARVDCVDSLLTGRLTNIAHLGDSVRFTRADVSAGLPSYDRLDFVFHLASPASPRHYQQHPIETLLAGSEGTRAAVELARQHRARCVFTSSSEVYGDPELHPQPETYWGRVNPIGPRSVYDEAKRFAEAMIEAYRRTHGVDTGIARIFNTYGPRMDAHDGRVVPTLLRQGLAGEPLTVFGDGSQTRSLCWVEDTVEGLLRLASSNETGPINIGSDEEWRIDAVAELVRELTGARSEIVHCELPQDDPALRRPDLKLARTRLGWSPRVGLREGLARTLTSMERPPARAGG